MYKHNTSARFETIIFTEFSNFFSEELYSFYLELQLQKGFSNACTALSCTEFYKTRMIIYFKLFKSAVIIMVIFCDGNK